jgi:hypothetical protein
MASSSHDLLISHDEVQVQDTLSTWQIAATINEMNEGDSPVGFKGNRCINSLIYTPSVTKYLSSFNLFFN